jgi:TRAP-type C4-dicarboxylate transport system substrate-binding protein
VKIADFELNEVKLKKEEVKLMKKKALFIFIAITLLLLPLFGQSKVVQAKPIEIKLGLNHIFPPTHKVSTDQFPRYISMVEKATKGKYKIKLNQFHPGMLLGGRELFDGVGKGIVDMGANCFCYNPGMFPVMGALAQAGVAPPKNCDAAALAAWEFYKKFKPKEVAGVKMLYTFATGPGWIHSKIPIRSLKDLRGLAVRATGNSGKAITALGGSPTAMTMPEVYLALQKGIVKASISPIETLQGFKQAEVTSYSTFFGFGYSEQFYVIMNIKKWKSLPKDLQAAFDAVSENATREAGAIWEYLQKVGRDFAVKKTGHKFIHFPDTEEKKIVNLLKPIRAQYIKKMNGLGLPGEELANEAGRIVKKNNAQTYKPYVP